MRGVNIKSFDFKHMVDIKKEQAPYHRIHAQYPLLHSGYYLDFLFPSPKPRVFCDKELVKYKVRDELVKS